MMETMCSMAVGSLVGLACRRHAAGTSDQATYGITQSRNKEGWKPSSRFISIHNGCIDIGKRTPQSRFGAELVDVLKQATIIQHGGHSMCETSLIPVLPVQSFWTLISRTHLLEYL